MGVFRGKSSSKDKNASRILPFSETKCYDVQIKDASFLILFIYNAFFQFSDKKH